MRPLGPDDPTTIGQYRLLGVLGSGGMGRVYLGRNTGGRTVAVKVVRPDLSDDTEFRTRFRREVAAARRVAGPYTVPVLDADVDAHRPWLATGFVSGLALSDAVEEYGPLPEPSLITLAIGLARALTDVHATGLVHRDLKPSNVLLAVDGPRVIDFGIARAADDTALTTTGKIIGSPGYMCPEQITGTTPVGPAGDMFALGGLLVYAATGTGPFGTGDSVSMLWRVVQGEPRLDGVPATLRPLIAACLEKEPESRPTPADLAARLAPLGTPDTRGWLPAPILEDISRRAIALLDLEIITPALDAPQTRPADPGGYPQQSGPQHRRPGPPAPPTHHQSGPYGHEVYGSSSGPRPVPPQGTPYADPTLRRDLPPPTPPSHRPRTALLAVAAVVILAAGALSAYLAYHHNTEAAPSPPVADTGFPDSATDSYTPDTTETTSATTSSTALPSDYIGTWKGTATDGLVAYNIVVDLKAGSVGDEVGTASNTSRNSGHTCERAETLTAASAAEITLRARLTGGDTSPLGCQDDGQSSTLSLLPDGNLNYRMQGIVGNIVGTLRKG
ncbi:serine/threonine-protein kinase [Nocardia blacklockiae]|uniref:serine/threonine-protein kinase n=1 Tax=Nocardia blacklockiae TaxID=480036 RepID=UPI001895B589|nr:serine/threonine-protein kinase [Nocardia blacklockiae]MBF6170619.1 protein kinase [Nocardia blacklockiae]